MTSGLGTTIRYHSNHNELLAANEANKFMWMVIRAHFNDLQSIRRYIEIHIICLLVELKESREENTHTKQQQQWN